jgi:glycosyltransferase involved in cell wall biosynthesis
LEDGQDPVLEDASDPLTGTLPVVSEPVDPDAPRLTVVTPVLNGVAFVEGCVRNVAEQNCELAEHVIVDGGSTDGTLTLLDRLVETVPRLRVLVRPGMRQSSAMNTGIQEGTGAIIGILNADDYYSPGTLNRVLELFPSFPTPTLLVGNCTLWSEGREVHVNRPSDLRLESVLLGPRHCEFPFNPVAYFYHRELHGIVGFYDEDDDFAMDVDFLLRALASVHTEYRDELWGHVRVHEGAKTQIEKASGRNRRRLRQVLNRHRRHLPLPKRIALRCRLLTLDARLGAGLAFRDRARLRRALARTS